jgi:hypothetical protein
MKKTRKPAKPRSKSRTRVRPKARARKARRRMGVEAREAATGELLRELTQHHGVSPVDTGGDVDADWQRAQSSGEEAVGGSVATPDQDIVDDLARPLGVERDPDAQVITSDEILSARDRRRWRTEQEADERARQADEG